MTISKTGVVVAERLRRFGRSSAKGQASLNRHVARLVVRGTIKQVVLVGSLSDRQMLGMESSLVENLDFIGAYSALLGTSRGRSLANALKLAAEEWPSIIAGETLVVCGSGRLARVERAVRRGLARHSRFSVV